MKRLFFSVSLTCALALCACAGDGGKELFETGKFEEVQNNKEHARELYEEVIKKYPGSKYAGMAGERLQEIKGK